MMLNEFDSRLDKLCNDFKEIKGKPFRYFYCPILFRDENIDLIEGHIINQFFPNSSRKWTIQRKDIDNFYGSHFEADFASILYYENGSPGNVLLDKNKSRLFRPKLLIDDEEIEYYVAEENIPKKFTQLDLINEDDRITLGLKKTPEDLSNIIQKKIEIEISKDIRLQALVSLIKSAHLTLFHMLGYNYAFSSGGYFVGKDILGKFFLENKNLDRSDIKKNSQSFFSEYSSIVRPIKKTNLDIRGTLSDHRMLICLGKNKSPWALVVYVKTSKQLHAVLLPVFDDPDSVAKYLQFIKNNNKEEIEVSNCIFKDGKWEVNKNSSFLHWPKTGNLIT